MTNTNLKNWCLAVVLAASVPAVAFAAPSGSRIPAAAAQQAADCKGVVTDAEGEPLIGASVMVVGTGNGTSTNIDGEFSLKGVKNGAKITISYIGFKPQTVTWNGEDLSVVLAEDGNLLDEVVVMGYGVEQKRAKVTNSIAKVSEKTLTVGSNSNPAQALAGAVSGVKVTVTSGDPSATPTITIRGGTGYEGSNPPLIVVDGQIRSSLSDINPNDIESMEILKDAGATALYGARAANGVILITSKSGKQGTGRVTLNVKYGVTTHSTGYDYADAETYITWFRRGLYLSSNPNPEVAGTTWLHNFFSTLDSGTQGYSAGNTTLTSSTNFNILTKTAENAYLLQQGWKEMEDPLNAYRDTQQTLLYRGIDPMEVNTNGTTGTQDYNLSFSGANDRGSYYASLGYYDADGALPTTFYKRYNFSFSGSYKISNWLEAKSVFNYTRANWNNTAKGVANDYVFSRYASMPPTARLTDEEGNNLYGYAGFNLNYEAEKFIRENQSDKFQMTQSLTATLAKGLTLKGTMSWYYNEEFDEAFNKDYHTNWTVLNVNRSSSASFLRYFDQTYNLVANFNRTFAEKHTVNVMAGWEFYKRQYKAFSASGNKAPTDDFMDLGYTFAGTMSPYVASSRSIDSSHANESILSFFGRAEYDYMDKYLVAVTFREDGYSRLQDNRWGAFPGVSAGWVFSKENFWSQNDALSFINYGKLRGSYGLNGVVNSDYIGYYTLLGQYSGASYAGTTGFYLSNLPNPGLKWERTRTFEVGLDLGFLQNRFNLGLTYYNRLTMDKYADLDLPPTTGWPSIVTNNGKYQNQGVEIDVNATLLRTRDFQWTLGANLTFNKNKIVELPDNGEENNRQGGIQLFTGNGREVYWAGGYQEGQEPNHLWGFKQDHMLRSWDDVYAMGDYIDISRTSASSVPIYANESGLARLKEMGLDAGAVRLSPGDLVWKDRNGDNMIETMDRFDLGNRTPHWTGGFNTTLTWKGLSLYGRFDMGWGFVVYDAPYAWAMGGGQGSFNFTTDILKTWTPENPDAELPRFVDASNMGTDSWIRTSDLIAKSGAYLACRELSLSYQLPEAICQKFKSQGLTLSVTGQNLGYLKKTTLPLPDNTTYTNGASSGWGGTYNLPLSVIFGLNVSF